MDLADRADIAIKRKDYLKAVKYYAAIAKAAPDRAIGFAKMCEMYELAGQRDNAMEACRAAVRISGVRPQDYDRYVGLLLAGTEPLTPARKAELVSIVGHLRQTPEAELAATQIECQVAARERDQAALTRCTRVLAERAPTDARTFQLQWVLAALQKDTDAARRILDEAKRAGIEMEGLNQMEQATRRARIIQSGLYLAVVALILAAAALLLSRRREIAAAFARRSAQ
jgi:tetratricopeptide (TPR) repeat protein